MSSRVQQGIGCNQFETYFQRHIAVVCSFIIKHYFSHSLIALGMRSLCFLLVSLLSPFHSTSTCSGQCNTMSLQFLFTCSIHKCLNSVHSFDINIKFLNSMDLKYRMVLQYCSVCLTWAAMWGCLASRGSKKYWCWTSLKRKLWSWIHTSCAALSDPLSLHLPFVTCSTFLGSQCSWIPESKELVRALQSVLAWEEQTTCLSTQNKFCWKCVLLTAKLSPFPQGVSPCAGHCMCYRNYSILDFGSWLWNLSANLKDDESQIGWSGFILEIFYEKTKRQVCIFWSLVENIFAEEWSFFNYKF